MKEKGKYLVPTLYRLDWLVENAEKTAADPKTLETLRTSQYFSVRSHSKGD